MQDRMAPSGKLQRECPTSSTRFSGDDRPGSRVRHSCNLGH